MLSLAQQIKEQKLICPKSRLPLVRSGGNLETNDGRQVYPLVGEVPILLADVKTRDDYLKQNDSAMEKEYRQTIGRLTLLKNGLNKDYRSRESIIAFEKAIAGQPANAFCVAIGGGPTRAHENLVNLNIDAFSNVDVVADAYSLPYADNCVDAIYCEAVLEHLEFPEKAVGEFWRVLKPGGQALAVTPFLQWFHGYPNHFQNFTLIGHERLFSRAGFTIVSSGPCVGPTYALSILLKCYIGLYVPFALIRIPLKGLVQVICLCVRPLDNWLHKSPKAHILASTTYVHAIKQSI